MGGVIPDHLLENSNLIFESWAFLRRGFMGTLTVVASKCGCTAGVYRV